MLYLDEQDIAQLGTHWDSIVAAIEHALFCHGQGSTVQPLKPYLRYRDVTNRIIAMPAFVGGSIDMAGLKWISSFPANLTRGLPRAHSIVVLNESHTGKPLCIINAATLSAIRTAAVSAVMLRHFDRVRPLSVIKVGIVGFGPIGRWHLEMVRSLLGNRIAEVLLYDVRPIEHSSTFAAHPPVRIVDSWQEAYTTADLFITCTVSAASYIDLPAKPGSLILNVSLRDFQTSVFPSISGGIVVDDWDEVCRENTDIEVMHNECALGREQVMTLEDVTCRDALVRLSAEQPIMFNPMGMAIFDIAVATTYYKLAQATGIGTMLPDNRR